MNMDQQDRQQLTRWVRLARTIHSWVAIVLVLFFLVVASTGLLLGWKKHSNNTILPKTEKGISDQPTDWLPMDTLYWIAYNTMRAEISTTMDSSLQRIDIRPHKGIAKFIYNEGFWGVQLDLTTGEVLAINKRYSDIIENFHDGSVLDYWLGTNDEQIKLSYTTIMGISLLTLSLSGLLLWLGPRYIRWMRRG